MTDYQGSGVNSTLDEIKAQLSTQHDAIVAKLDAIATAIGAPPPSGTITLADISTLIQGTNTRLDTLITAIGTLNTTATTIANASSLTSGRVLPLTDMATNLITLLSAIQDFATRYEGASGTEQLLENVQFGIRDLRTTMIANSCCLPSGIPALDPPIDTTPFPTSEQQLKCKRAQRFIDWFENTLLDTVVNTYSTLGVMSVAIIAALLVEAAATLLPAFEAVSAISGGSISAIAAGLSNIQGATIGQLKSQFGNQGLKNELRQAIYNADSASEARDAWMEVISSHTEIFSPIRAIWNALSIPVWFNQLFDPNSNINVEGYDGTICAGVIAITGEWLFGNGVTQAPWHAPYYMINWSDYPELPLWNGQNENLDFAALRQSGSTTLHLTFDAANGSDALPRVQESNSSTRNLSMPVTIDLTTTTDLNLFVYAAYGLNARLRLTIS